MGILKLICIIGCSFACGWFTLASIQVAIDRIDNWRDYARWAVAAAACVAGVLLLFP